MTILKIILITLLLIVTFQDLKDRMVYWILFPLITIVGASLYLQTVLIEIFLSSILLNTIILTFLLSCIYIYSKYKLREPILSVIGMGDIMLFLTMAFCFPTVSFIIIFVFSLIFSLSLHLGLKKVLKDELIPLAGYMSIFIAITYLSSWTGIISSLYNF